MRLPVYRREDDGALVRATIAMPIARFLAHDIAPADVDRLPASAARDEGVVSLGRGYFAARRGGCAVWLLAPSEVEVEGQLVTVAEKLVIAGGETWLLDLEGRVTRAPAIDRLARFEDAIASRPPAHTPVWPLPFPPIAIVREGATNLLGLPTTSPADDAHGLTRPAWCLPSAEATFPYRLLAGVPIIRSSAIIAHLDARTTAGLYHPERAPRAEARRPGDTRVLFGVAHRAWRDLAALSRGRS
ncbi:MAG: hypothetical protein IT385_27145 [Deltaproteobacteria bacterium]|nr:hypothetical protein [Deltaproteobacteria bacterium]